MHQTRHELVFAWVLRESYEDSSGLARRVDQRSRLETHTRHRQELERKCSTTRASISVVLAFVRRSVQLCFCTHKVAKIVNGRGIFVSDDEVVCGTCCSFNCRMGLQIEVLVVRRCDYVVDRSTWTAIPIIVGYCSIFRIESNVVALPTNDSNDIWAAGSLLRVDSLGELFYNLSISSAKGGQLMFYYLVVLAFTYSIAVVNDSLRQGHIFLSGWSHLINPVYQTFADHDLHIINDLYKSV
jgi:hypothetical protein